MEERINLPILPLRGFIVFPHQLVNFDVVRPASLKALERAIAENSEILVGFQKNMLKEKLDPDDLYEVVLRMRITKILKEENGTRVMGEVKNRCRLIEFDPSGSYYRAEAEVLPRMETESDYEKALCRTMQESFEEYAHMADLVPHAAYMALGLRYAGDIADLIASNIPGDFQEKLEILLEEDPVERAHKVIQCLAQEKQILKMRKDLQSEVAQEMQNYQRENFLREEMHRIQQQLGEESEEEGGDWEEFLNNADIPAAVRKKVQVERKRLAGLPPMSQEASVIQDYLDRIRQVPWDMTETVQWHEDPQQLLETSRELLEMDHYGLKRVKDRVIEYIASKCLRPEISSPILCLVGPPGIGKTSIAKSIADTLGRKYVRVSLGGVRDEAEIRGHRRTYVGAMPGRIVNALIQADSMCPVMLLDEIDKMASDLRGDPTAALLEVLDTSLNHEFRDAYLEVPVDLSRVFFIATANTLDGIPLPLMDRMEIIELESYSRQEKLEIAMKYLLPRQRKEYGLKAAQLKISRAVMEKLIVEYTREAGVRELERLIASLCRKAACMFVAGERASLSITERNLAALMDEPPIKEEENRKSPECGVVNGLAWTAMGGEVLTVEAAVLDGSGKLELTGQMGDVMKESAQIALSVVREHSIPEKDARFYKEHDLHIHIPAGAVPKDGPSAGVTLATAIYSVVSGRKVRNDLAMTGELSLRGRVLPIGGLKEKLLAAKGRGIFEVLVPEANRMDVEKLDKEITDGMKILYITHIDEVFREAIQE